ncbi:MAG: hypothetical protein JO256_07135 [Alphaproteobacteria bacterium]|nr:hypothetical protein [Alphaproteobacteria bacterium]
MTARSQQGSALVFVGMVGLIVSLMFALFMNSSVLVEQRAVEAELARSRTYWAEMGTFNYALSRISYSKLCGSGCTGNQSDLQAVPTLQAYFNELNNIKTFSYLDEASGYTITATTTGGTDGVPGQHNFSNYLMATSSYTASSLVAASAGTLPLLELRFCEVPSQGAHCGLITNNNGSNRYQYFTIRKLTNLPSP